MADEPAPSGTAERLIQRLENAAVGDLFQCRGDREEAVGIAQEEIDAAIDALAAQPVKQGGAGAGEGWRSVMRNLLREFESNTCTHENTHRGGFLWTICDDCGRKWADDQGGFVPYSPPAAVVAAEALLSAAPPPAAGEAVGGMKFENCRFEGSPDGGFRLAASLSPTSPTDDLAKLSAGASEILKLLRDGFNSDDGQVKNWSLQTAHDKLAALSAPAAPQAPPLYNDAELEADPQKMIAHLHQQCLDHLKEINEWKAAALAAPQATPLGWAYEFGAETGWERGFAYRDERAFNEGKPEPKAFIRNIQPVFAQPAAPQATEEPVAWDYEYQSKYDTVYHSSAPWLSSVSRERPNKTHLNYRNIRPLYAAPAASRIGVTEEEVARAPSIGNFSRQDWFKCEYVIAELRRLGEHQSADAVHKAALIADNLAHSAKIALLAAPRAGGETPEDGWSAGAEAMRAAAADHLRSVAKTFDYSGRGGLGEMFQAQTGRDIAREAERVATLPLPAPPAEQDENRGEGL